MSGSSINFYNAVQAKGIENALSYAQQFANSQGHIWTEGSSVIFRASSIEQLAPSFRGKILTNEQAIEKWVNAHFGDFNNRPSQRVSNPPGTKHDSALDMVIKAKLNHLTDDDLDSIKWAHRLGMSAENIFGTILEEYLSVRLAPHNWYCAWGSVLKAVDFVSSDGQYLQVKSRNNTENSSSNKIRLGTDIKKWWRFHATNGSTNWPELNQKLGINTLSEDDFKSFVLQLVTNNPSAMAVEQDNSWNP
ncbi:MAG: SinI family restriction endonuclease [Psychrobium sp.]